MAIDRDKFVYRIGDKVRALGTLAEWEIIKIQGAPNSHIGNNDHYRIRNTRTGCLDSPIWVSGRILYNNFEPCNSAIKILFDRGSRATQTSSSEVSAERKHGGLDGD